MEKIEKLKHFLLASPGDSFLQHALALEFIKAGDEEGARELFMEILNREPGYIGSYYHLAQLFVRAGQTDLAMSWFEKGMEASKKAGDMHALRELQAAYNDLIE